MIASDINKIETEKYPIKTTDQLLLLMDIYYSEWEHRDSLMWKQIFSFFFAVFVVILLPFAKIWNITLAEKIPNFVFPITGIALSFVFLYISMEYARRLSKIGKSYRELIEQLPEEFQRKHIYSKGKIKPYRQIAYIIPALLFLILIVFGLTILILCFN